MKKTVLVLSLATLMILLSACKNALGISSANSQTKENKDTKIETKENVDSKNETKENKDKITKDYDIEKIDRQLVDGSQEFAFNIFKELNKEDLEESIFISPLSISQALTMTYNGAETSTKEGMEKVLGFSGLDRTLVNESYKNLNNFLKQIDDKIELNIGNSIWVRENQAIKEEFLRTNERTFNARVESLDFTDLKSADIINDWIKNATEGKIDKMLTPPIPPETIMYLINAIYFKGNWNEQFDPKLTYKDDFTTLKGDVQKVNMMMREETSVEYTEGKDFKAVRLPYGDKKVSMYIILPAEGLDINEFINNITLDKWTGIKKTVSEKKDIIFRIPKFKLEYGIKDLTKSLKTLGMEEAFTKEADFSSIGNNLFISGVLHKAVIEVNEEGSEAAASTVVSVDVTSVREPLTFIANRPFMFIINDDVMDTILFMGKVVNIEE